MGGEVGLGSLRMQCVGLDRARKGSSFSTALTLGRAFWVESHSALL